MDLDFDLWRRSTTVSGLGFKEKCNVWVAIWILVEVNLRFWVVAVVASWLRRDHGCAGSPMLLLITLFLAQTPNPYFMPFLSELLLAQWCWWISELGF